MSEKDQTLKMDMAGEFPHLPHAPIVEAVIEIRARAQGVWSQEAISAWLKPKLPDYPTAHAQKEYRAEVAFGPEGATQRGVDLSLKGIRFQSTDKRQVAQFNRDGFVFSRLAPYENWNRLCGEALRLWALQSQLAKPAGVQRLGLRFVNRIVASNEAVALRDYLSVPPQPPTGLNLPFAGFLHHDAFAVPGHPYAINLIRTIQPPVPNGTGVALILDIDVCSTQPFDAEGGMLEQRLNDMRWLKNKVFFGSVTERALEGFR
jgi:uncharacterized protein (TIGR04255 family)